MSNNNKKTRRQKKRAQQKGEKALQHNQKEELRRHRELERIRISKQRGGRKIGKRDRRTTRAY